MRRAAGERLNLPAELVTYIGQEAQAGRPMDDGVIRTHQDAAIAEAVGAAVVQAVGGEGA